MKYVVIVNGKPGSGKTTFQNKCVNHLEISDRAYGHIHSSIDYIKSVYKQLGWNGKKTDKARKDLSVLKQMWIDNCNGPLKHTMEFVVSLDNNSDHVVFVDIREESEIIKFMDTFNALRPIDIRCTTVLIDRDYNTGLEYGNKSDDNVGQNISLYENIIHNNGSIDDLGYIVRAFMDELLEEE